MLSSGRCLKRSALDDCSVLAILILSKCSGPEVIKLFSCSTQLSTKFQLLTKLKYRQIKKFITFSLSDVVFIMLVNAKMPTITIVGILTFMSRINFVLR